MLIEYKSKDIDVEQNFDWERTIDALNLTGSTLNFAKNCSVIQFSDTLIELNLTPDREALKTKTGEEQLQQALQQHFSAKLTLKIHIGQSDSLSPQQSIEKHAQKALQSAQSSIENDPLIKDLMSKMGATLNPSSITPC